MWCMDKLKMRFKAGNLLWILGSLVLVILWLKIGPSTSGKPGVVSVDTPIPRDISKSNAEFLQEINLVKEPAKFEVSEVSVEKTNSKTGPGTGNTGEVRHVALLKVHKTASSTAQNVFLRFGDSRKLNFILPHTKGESGWPNVISYVNSITDTNVVPAPKGEHFDILCCHVLYNREQFQKVLPADTVYIGIVREPISRFQSAVKYFSPKFILKIPGAHPVSQYLKNPTKHDHADPRDSQLNNRMATEFGFPQELFPGKSLNGSTVEINKYLDKLDKEFKFVIISERFDESMVMMRRLLNWTMKDVLYIDQNKGVTKPNPKKLMQESDDLPAKAFLYLDEALYTWAIKRFVRQISAEGEDFIKEVEFFQKVVENLKEFCKSSRKTMVVEETPWNKEFSMAKEYCAMFTKHEKDLILRQRMRMYGTAEN